MKSAWHAMRRVPYIAQLENTECGAACLAMILAYHHHHAPLTEVREACAVSRDGVNALALMSAAESYGLRTIGYAADTEELRQIPLPAILHWEFNHFVVLERLNRRGGARIVDPARGRFTASEEMLEKCFTGAVLTFEPTDALQHRVRRPPNLSRYRELLRANGHTIGLLIGLSFVLQIVGFVFPLGQQFLVDHIFVQRQESWLWSLAAALFGAMVVQALLQFARGWTLSTMQAVIDLRLLVDFMRHAVRLPLGFFLQRNPGDLLQRLQSNSELRAFLGAQIASSILDSFLIVGYAALMLAYQWQLGLIVVAIGCFRAFFQILMRGLNRRAMATELTALSGAGATLVETLAAIETIRSVAAEGFAIRRWSDRVVQRASASQPRLQLENTAAQLTTLVCALGVAVVSAVAGYQVLSGEMSIGVFSAFLTLQALYLTPFNSLIEGIEHWQVLGSYLSRLDDVMEATPEHSGEDNAASLRGAIRLDGIHFRYSPAAPWVLREINICIRPGEKIAVVGLSGSGKSTLARLLLGMLTPTEGTVYYDEKDMRDYNLSKLRRRMGAVLQEIDILSQTVSDNICLNDLSMSMENIKWSAQLANIDAVIEALPKGYDTRIGENGAQLSGGERQRLCIARALAHHPAILLLDEATSALDSKTEQRINETLSQLSCTRIVIAHRLNTVRDADRILVLDGGTIVQEGTFDTLKSAPGLFQRLLGSLESPESQESLELIDA